jgi:putative membrane protein
MTASTTTRNIPASALAGTVGGLTASCVMNQFQALIAKIEAKHPQPQPAGDDATVKTAQAISKYILGRELAPAEKKRAGVAVHYSFGALLGAVYGVLAATDPKARAGAGTAYGAAVWLAVDEILVPAFGLSGSPMNSPVSSHVKALASHLVYGVTTDFTRNLILKLSNGCKSPRGQLQS